VYSGAIASTTWYTAEPVIMVDALDPTAQLACYFELLHRRRARSILLAIVLSLLMRINSCERCHTVYVLAWVLGFDAPGIYSGRRTWTGCGDLALARRRLTRIGGARVRDEEFLGQFAGFVHGFGSMANCGERNQKERMMRVCAH
jgi:hypothetical protein